MTDKLANKQVDKCKMTKKDIAMIHLRTNEWFLLQHTSLSPDCKLITVVGDHLDGLLVDSTNGKAITCEYNSSFIRGRFI